MKGSDRGSLHDIPIGAKAPHIVRAVIEIPRGSKNKYEYDDKLHAFRLDRVLYSAVHYPVSYGFIPQTIAEDGDPIDILILLDEEISVGVVVEVRPIGMLVMKDKKNSDHKILSVVVDDPRYSEFHEADEMPKHLLVEIEHFFETYSQLEGKRVQTFGWEEAKAARHLIQTGVRSYRREHRPKSRARKSNS